jgi:mannose-1-phosphate guanylyltransferase
VTYTVLVTVKVSADSEHEAYGFIQHALDHAKKAEIVHIDSEVIETKPDEALADRQQQNREMWADYRGER